MEKLNVKLLVLLIFIMIGILDILKNLKIFKSKKMIFLGIYSYLSLLIFYIILVFYPSGMFWFILIAIPGGVPCAYFWYLRTTQAEKRKETFLTIGLVIGLIIFYIFRNS